MGIYAPKGLRFAFWVRGLADRQASDWPYTFHRRHSSSAILSLLDLTKPIQRRGPQRLDVYRSRDFSAPQLISSIYGMLDLFQSTQLLSP